MVSPVLLPRQRDVVTLQPGIAEAGYGPKGVIPLMPRAPAAGAPTTLRTPTMSTRRGAFVVRGGECGGTTLRREETRVMMAMNVVMSADPGTRQEEAVRLTPMEVKPVEPNLEMAWRADSMAKAARMPARSMTKTAGHEGEASRNTARQEEKLHFVRHPRSRKGLTLEQRTLARKAEHGEDIKKSSKEAGCNSR